jgi:hypothetical protein
VSAPPEVTEPAGEGRAVLRTRRPAARSRPLPSRPWRLEEQDALELT